MNIITTFRNAWKVNELRNKIIFTLFIILIFRIGAVVAVPFIDRSVLIEMFANTDGTFWEYSNMLSGGAFGDATIFALAVAPYINASIIIQLLSYAIGPLEKLTKEGPEGRKKLNKITKYVALGIALAMSVMYYFKMKSQAAIVSYDKSWQNIFAMVVIILCFTAGAQLIIFLGDQINEHGIGNGISMILFASIVSRFPADMAKVVETSKMQNKAMVYVPLVAIIFLAMIVLIIIMNDAERRIPIQYAQRVVGRKMYGGQNSNIPIKVSMSGVMPIIFAMSFMQVPSVIATFAPPKAVPHGFWQNFYAGFVNLFKYTGLLYAIFYFILIIAFNYFYVAMQYNPTEIAQNLRQNNGGIPGIRPGKPTSDFIQRILSKITIVGAVFLGIIAIAPIIFQGITEVRVAMGGTSILIVVGVALETARALESQMMMRHHKGFLE